ncbi:MAG: low specificity L-threonine aldolase [Arenicellales bacterium]|jgi:threonine aldolase|nr:low specificity L-threonine aldolase [Arenicellales bacterium]
MPLFASDNVTAVCPDVMSAIQNANIGTAPSYGDDDWTKRLKARLSDLFECEVVVFPTLCGTSCNALALASITPPFGTIYCHQLAHINTDECNAPEFYTGGAKLISLSGSNGKLTAKGLQDAIIGKGDVHHSQPSTVSLTQSSESGTLYRVDEIQAITMVARHHGLKVHMDGARIANAMSALAVTPAEMTWKAGIDVLSLGGTKNGCMGAEALVFFNKDDAQMTPFLHKRSGQLLSKMRFVSAQLLAYLSDDLWLKNAAHANAMAERLSAGLKTINGVELAYPTEANEVFVRLPWSVIEELERAGFDLNEDELVRFVCAWDTRDEDVDKLLSIVEQATST